MLMIILLLLSKILSKLSLFIISFFHINTPPFFIVSVSLISLFFFQKKTLGYLHPCHLFFELHLLREKKSVTKKIKLIIGIRLIESLKLFFYLLFSFGSFAKLTFFILFFFRMSRI